MTQNTSEVIVDALCEWGVDTIFGMPGDGINGFMEALRKSRDRIRFVQCRHEESAAFMACGYAKFTGRLGVCMATSGPGAIHLLNGLYDAKMDGQPVLAITGNQFHDLMNTHGQQDVPLERLFDDVAAYNVRVMSAEHAENVVHLACREALYGRCVAHLTLPADVQTMKRNGARTRRNVKEHVGQSWDRYRLLPDERALRHAAEILDRGERVAILAGRGALGAGAKLQELAVKLGAPIVKALLGKSVVPDDSPYTTGSLGLLGTRPSQDVMERCDVLLMVGTSFPYVEFYPEPGTIECVQIDRDPTRIGLRHPVDVGLVGDSLDTLEALLPLVHDREDKTFLIEAQTAMKRWWRDMEERGTSGDMPMKPQVVAWELGKLLRDDAIVACDSGTVSTWWARQIIAREGQMHTVSGNLASMACALPYAIAGQLAYPDRQCVAFIGDGGFSMLLGELATCIKYDLPVKIVVIKNDSLAQIKWEQMVFEGNPEYGCELQPIDFASVARGFGARAYTIDDPSRCGEQLREALDASGPVVVEAVVDPFTPPLPPRIEWEQARNFAKSLARGEPHPLEQALTATKDKVRELI